MWQGWQVVGMVSIALALYDLVIRRMELSPVFCICTIMTLVSIWHLM